MQLHSTIMVNLPYMSGHTKGFAEMRQKCKTNVNENVNENVNVKKKQKKCELKCESKCEKNVKNVKKCEKM